MFIRALYTAAGWTAVLFSFIIVGNFTNELIANAAADWWERLLTP